MSVTAMPRTRRTNVTTRRILFWMHLWVGLILGIPFAFLGVSGSLLVYEQQISDWLAPSPQATALGEMRGPQAILDAAAAVKPGANPLILQWPQGDGEPAIVRIAPPGARGARGSTQVYVDPASLTVLDAQEGFRSPFMRTIHEIHGNMLIDGRDGRDLVGWFGVGMLLLGLTGIVLWWPRGNGWKTAFGVSKGATGWLLYRQLHGSVGIFGWVIFIILSFSGIAITFPQTTSAIVRTVLNEGPSKVAVQGPGGPQIRVQPVEGATKITADKAVELARAAVPGTRLVSMFLPQGREQPIRVNLLGGDTAQGAPAISVAVDPYKGEVVNVRDPWAGDAGDDVMTWQRPLHTGRGTSEIYKLAIFIVGFMPVLFAVTGTLMWWVKRRNRSMARRRTETALEGVPAE